MEENPAPPWMVESLWNLLKFGIKHNKTTYQLVDFATIHCKAIPCDCSCTLPAVNNSGHGVFRSLKGQWLKTGTALRWVAFHEISRHLQAMDEFGVDMYWFLMPNPTWKTKSLNNVSEFHEIWWFMTQFLSPSFRQELGSFSASVLAASIFCVFCCVSEMDHVLNPWLHKESTCGNLFWYVLILWSQAVLLDSRFSRKLLLTCRQDTLSDLDDFGRNHWPLATAAKLSDLSERGANKNA